MKQTLISDHGYIDSGRESHYNSESECYRDCEGVWDVDHDRKSRSRSPENRERNRDRSRSREREREHHSAIRKSRSRSRWERNSEDRKFQVREGYRDDDRNSNRYRLYRNGSKVLLENVYLIVTIIDKGSSALYQNGEVEINLY